MFTVSFWQVLTLDVAMQWSQFDKLLGRAGASEADPEGRVPVWGTAPTTEIKDRFAKLGIKPRQVS